MAAVLVLCLSQVSAAQGGHLSERVTEGLPSRASGFGHVSLISPSRSEKCSARKAVRYYSRRISEWRGKMGAGGRTGPTTERASDVRVAACPLFLAHVLQRKAHAARLAYLRWHRDQYEWRRWLPDKFARVGACETGYGRKPGSWTWDSGTYVSAFGIYRPAYEAYHRWTGRNTPREQYEVAAAIQARFGWGAWGCGRA